MAIEAQWNLSLDVDCPHCGEYVDLLKYPDFWDGRSFSACEHLSENSKNVEVNCPECGEEFEVDLTY